LRPAAAFAACAGALATQLLLVPTARVESASAEPRATKDPEAPGHAAAAPAMADASAPSPLTAATEPAVGAESGAPAAAASAHAHGHGDARLHGLVDPNDPAGPLQHPVHGPLPQTLISRIVDRKRGELRAKCAGPHLTGHVVVTLIVGLDGRVYSARTSGAPAAAAACFERTARTWRFPPSDSPTTVELPFFFLSQ
jgi:hypothetical protein